MLFFPLCLPLLSVANISLAFPWQNCHSDSFLLPVSSFSPRPLPLTCTHTNTHNVHLTASFLFTISFWNEITLCRYSFSSCDFLNSCKSCHCKEGGRDNIHLGTIFSKATFFCPIRNFLRTSPVLALVFQTWSKIEVIQIDGCFIPDTGV